MEPLRPSRGAVRSGRVLPVVFLLVTIVASVCSHAKDKPLTGVLLYEGAKGPAYLQLSDIVLNGKTEVYVCTKGAALDGSSYKKLPRTALGNAQEMELDADGALAMKTGEGVSCVVPQNVKFEKNAQMSAKDLAAKAVLTGSVLGKSANGDGVIPELKNGFKLYVAPANDTELAEYLRAAHWHTLDLLKMYIAQYPQGAHVAAARQTLAGLITDNAEKELAAYVKSVEEKSTQLDHLRNAKQQCDEALGIVAGLVRAQKVALDVRGQVQEIVAQGRTELKAFQTALAERTAGYDHLVKARKLADDALKVDGALDTVLKLAADVGEEDQKLELAVASAQKAVAQKQFDAAYNAIAKYRAMSAELPKVAAVVDAAFAYHRDQGGEFAHDAKWESAISEFRRALSLKEDTATVSALKNAEKELQTEQDKSAAQKAIDASKEYSDKKQYVEAYELLANLSAGQRAFVGDELEGLEKPFVQDAVKRADTLTRLHVPIRGRADEDATRQGFHLLTVVSRLTEDEAIKVKLDLLSDRISEYYLVQARKMFDKPRGSGAGVGWKYLQLAQRFKPESTAVKDEMTKRAPMYEMRSKLSLGIRFRDQTSRRDSLGFADQLTDAVAASLEQAGVPSLKVVTSRKSGEDTAVDALSGLEPNFQLQCDILQHRVNKKVDSQRVQSHYRAGTREVKNPAWTDLKRQFDAASDEYNRLKDNILASGKKPNTEVTQTLQALQAKVEEARKKMDTVAETQLEDIIQPYNYTKRTTEITGVVEFAFRLASAGEAPREMTTVKMELPKTATVLENVKPEDTDGVQEEGTPLDELDVLSDAERAAQGALIKNVIEKLQGLPPRVLDDARAKVSGNDVDAAAESYILFLNCALGKESPEKTEALQFLNRQYNISETAGE